MDQILSAGFVQKTTTMVTTTILNSQRYLKSIQFDEVYANITEYLLNLAPVELFAISLIFVCVLAAAASYVMYLYFGPTNFRNSKVYVNDVVVFTDFRPEWSLDLVQWKERQLNMFKQSEDAVEFTHKMVHRSGMSLGKQHVAPGLATDPPDLTIASARYEAEYIMFGCVEKLLAKNNVAPDEIDILVVNCSLFNPTPSLCAMIINKFKFREDIITYNLSGMGCSASPLAVQCASHNLKLHPKKHPLAIVMSLEILTSHFYQGTQREFLMSNALFRMNGAAILLSRDNTAVYKRPAPKWRIDHLERVHLGASDKAFQAIHLDNDDDNHLGVRISKDLMSEAARGLTLNLSLLGPKILPYSELIKTGIRMAWKYLMTSDSSHSASGTPKPLSQGPLKKNEILAEQEALEKKKRDDMIVPNFKTCVDYWLIHAGGKAIISGIKDSLSLTEEDCRASRNVLYKYGNTSSSSIWYEIDEVENTYTVTNGQHALAIAVGSGIKVQTMYLTAVNRK
jgi:3-ketoacyl-CoA synthase